eukprot:6185061-Pleurochrysis_carterae.AAC.1
MRVARRSSRLGALRSWSDAQRLCVATTRYGRRSHHFALFESLQTRLAPGFDQLRTALWRPTPVLLFHICQPRHSVPCTPHVSQSTQSTSLTNAESVCMRPAVSHLSTYAYVPSKLACHHILAETAQGGSAVAFSHMCRYA